MGGNAQLDHEPEDGVEARPVIGLGADAAHAAPRGRISQARSQGPRNGPFPLNVVTIVATPLLLFTPDLPIPSIDGIRAQ